MSRVAIGLLGLGTIGSGVARLLNEARERVAHRAGRPIEIKRVLVRDLSRPRSVPLPDGILVTDPRAILDDPEIEIVVEVLGGTDPALRLVERALAAGKHVVTANKALLAEHGPEVFAAARKADRAVAFEASVGGGIPIIQALQVGLAANQVQTLSAILNGTCNFILTAMSREGRTYRDALAQAQELGYAEPDPTLDVNGTDTAHKLAILAQLAFGTNIHNGQIPRQGIDQLDVADIRYAGELGYAVKLLAQAKLGPGGLELRVAPRLVRRGTPLAEVSGPYNAIRVTGDAVGDTLFYGRGAGAMPTASAVVGDLIDVVIGRAMLTNRALDPWAEGGSQLRLAPPDQIRSRYYLRFLIADRPGVIAALAQILGRYKISISSVIQHETSEDAPDDAPVPLIIMTHQAVEADMTAALAEIDRLDIVAAPSVCLGVDES